MKCIALARIDDRLIHGQVVTNWIKVTDTTDIYVVDDQLVNDVLMKRVLNAAAPKGIPVSILTVEESIAKLKEEPSSDKERILILTKFPQPYEKMLEEGIKLEKIILGGMGMRGNRKQIHRNISANDEEIECMKRIIAKGTPIVYQLTNKDSADDVQKYLK